ncbi:uncharacterized protein LOC124434364 [Xenia sp. Carnegie-2017]|uniref:uncharacterized protein LOC124434364 n=1 Tax=Xenia sp. Carnegie-2017 TaxID=2897299 RepID=UPI001F034FBB|nr:uncharacterized protein LOC124434364 [Xenia sp. Carnegie-2017]
MALKRKPLDMARSRLKTKLNEIEEQKSSIENYLQQMTSKVKQSACSLLEESNSGRFFKAYRTVNQQLEKCLEDLFIISASISSIDDEQTELDGPFNEEDDHQTVEILKDKASAQDLKNIEKADLSDACSQKDFSEDTLKDSLSSVLSLNECANIEHIVNELSSELSTDFPLVTEDRKNDSQDRL